ncbi:MAG: SUMF1/EgtB/PvdO family nonheme iron enzyme, partial [Aeoliella sp.]
MQATIQRNNLVRGDWRRWVSFSLPALAIGTFLIGLVWRSPGLIGGGAIALCAVWTVCGGTLLQSLQRFAPLKNRKVGRQGAQAGPRQRQSVPDDSSSMLKPPVESPTSHRAKNSKRNSKGAAELVESMIDEGRYALLLRPETISELSQSEVEEVLAVMDERMSVIPEGRVLVGEYAERATWGATPTTADSAGLEWVDGCYLDRFAVTNAQFQNFVDAGGYEQFELWPDEALPALFEFVDRTWAPSPASWTDAQYPDGEEDFPVVGVSWYEAAAYARWVGRRLPTDAEWTKAGAWPVETSPGRVTQRRYPWGDTFEARRAALWSAGQNGPRPVDAYELGASLGGVCQLIGNVWEWTTSPLESTTRENAANGHGLK